MGPLLSLSSYGRDGPRCRDSHSPRRADGGEGLSERGCRPVPDAPEGGQAPRPRSRPPAALSLRCSLAREGGAGSCCWWRRVGSADPCPGCGTPPGLLIETPGRQEQGLTDAGVAAGGLGTGQGEEAFAFLLPAGGAQVLGAHL